MQGLRVPGQDLGPVFPGGSPTAATFPASRWESRHVAACKLLAFLLFPAVFCRIQVCTTQVSLTGFVPGCFHLHFLGLKCSLNGPN